MSLFIGRIARYAVQKLATDRVAREQAKHAARLIADEVKTIAREKDHAYAAGRSVRRLLRRFEDARRGG